MAEHKNIVKEPRGFAEPRLKNTALETERLFKNVQKYFNWRIYLIETQIENLQSVEVLEEASVNFRNVIWGKIENDEAVEAAEDARLDPVLVEAVSGKVEDLERGQVDEDAEVDGAQRVVGQLDVLKLRSESGNFWKNIISLYFNWLL